jgi:integrase
LGYVIIALATTGLRISELAGLRWTDCDLNNNTLTLPDTSRHGTRKQRDSARTTKGKYTRSLPIHPELLMVLQSIQRNPDGRVFHGPEGGVLKPDTVRIILIRDVIAPLKDKFPDPPGEEGFSRGRLHSIRHYFCSIAADEGVPEQMLMRWLGHKESRMVRHYYHLREKASQAHMTRLNLVGTAAAALRPSVPITPETPAADGSVKQEQTS